MDLKIYSKEGRWRNLGYNATGIINIHKKGQICLNAYMVSTLGLQPGDQMVIAKDIDTRNDWYISFGDEAIQGFKMSWLHSRNRKTLTLAGYYNLKAVQEILKSVNAEVSASFIIATEKPKTYGGRQWYRILTSNPIHLR